MKEFEEFAKAISIGMKALAKMIETAADQIEGSVACQTETPASKKTAQSPEQNRKNQGQKTAKSPKSAPQSPSKIPDDKTGNAKASGIEEPASPRSAAGGAERRKAKAPTSLKAPKKQRPKTGKPAKGMSDTEAVLRHIQSANEGIPLDDIQKRTGFPKKKLHNIIHRLKKTGRISAPKKGFYTAK